MKAGFEITEAASQEPYSVVLDSEAAPLEVVRLSNSMEERLVSAIEAYCPEVLLCDGFVAGGFVRDVLAGDDPNDLDVFLYGDSVMAEAEKLLSRNWTFTRGSEKVRTYENGTKIVQLIRFDEASPDAMIARFDFTVCCAGIGTLSRQSFAAPAFLSDLQAKQLRFLSLPYPVDSLRRVAKMLRRGYAIDPAELMRLQQYTMKWLQEKGVGGLTFFQEAA